jgi:hypothetical protein
MKASWEISCDSDVKVLSQIPIIVNMHVHPWVEGAVIPGHLSAFWCTRYGGLAGL